jgi:hypothetical protein
MSWSRVPYIYRSPSKSGGCLPATLVMLPREDFRVEITHVGLSRLSVTRICGWLADRREKR